MAAGGKNDWYNDHHHHQNTADQSELKNEENSTADAQTFT
jgi:hypothetical protein